MMEGGSEFRSYVVCNLRITLDAVETVPHKSVLAIINHAAMNIGVLVSLSLLVFSVCMPSSGIAGS